MTENARFSIIENNVVINYDNKEDFLLFDVNELLEQAINETQHIANGEVFLVRDLFKGYVWNRIPHKNRLLLGTLFLNYVNKLDSRIVAIEKTSSNQQQYKIK